MSETIKIIQNELIVREDGSPKSASFRFLGHIEITPKYIKARHTFLWGFASEGYDSKTPITEVMIYFANDKVQGEKNELGSKRLIALLKWIDKQETEIIERNSKYSYADNQIPISQEEFLKLL